MKKLWWILFVIASLLVSAVPVYPYTVGAASVGLLDELLSKTDLSKSGDETELAWVKSVLGNEVTLERKYDVTGTVWAQTDVLGVWALDLQVNPEYFLLKIGNTAVGGTKKAGKTPATAETSTVYSHYLFRNKDSFNWAVVNLAGLDILDVMAVSKISHVAEVEGGGSGDPGGEPVPEPATFLLIALGLLTVGLSRWKKS